MSTSSSELQSTTVEIRPGLLKGEIVVRTSHPGGFFASEELQELVRAFLERLGDGLLQAISFQARRRRLRRRLQEVEEETVSFTAEVAAGRSLEAAAKLQAPPEVAEAALAAAAAEVGAAETLQVRSVIVTEILEVESEGSQPPPVAADGTWLGIVAVLLAGALVIAAAVVGIWCFFKRGRNKKYAAGQGTADPSGQVHSEAPPASLPDLSGPNDLHKSRSSNMITSHL